MTNDPEQIGSDPEIDEVDDESQKSVPNPNYAKLDGETKEAWESRYKAEEIIFAAAWNADYSLKEGESEEDWKSRVNSEDRDADCAYDAMVEETDNALDGESESDTNARHVLAAEFKVAQEKIREDQRLYGFAAVWDKPNAVKYLVRLKEVAYLAEAYARNIREDLAKSWANGEIAKGLTDKELKMISEGEPLPNKVDGSKFPRGATVDNAIFHFVRCAEIWDWVSDQIPDTTGKAPAADIYDAYSTALDKYWALIDRETEGLKKPGVRHYLGPPLLAAFERNLNKYQTVSDKIAKEVSPSLDTTKQSKLSDWAKTTTQRLHTGIQAAKG